MNKLQIIYKENGIIKNDQSFECNELKNISLNNIPYYLTIQGNNRNTIFEYSYLNSYDCKELISNGFNIKYGIKSGRLYTVVLSLDISEIDNRKWTEIEKAILQNVSFIDKMKSDFKYFLKIIHNLIQKKSFFIEGTRPNTH